MVARRIHEERHKRGLITCVGALLLLACAGGVKAQPSSLVPEIHGFVSQGFLYTTDNDYLAESHRGSFEFSEVGVNLTSNLSDELRIGVQLFAHDLGAVGNYSAKFDWYYIDYHPTDWLGVRVGRVKIPFGLYNEINDIDSARVPALLPQSLYPLQSRDFLLAQTGGEVYGRLSLEQLGVLEYRGYGGTIYVSLADRSADAEPHVSRLNVPYVVGGRAMWETPLPGLRAGFSAQALRLDADAAYDGAALTAVQMAPGAPMDFDGRVRLRLPAVLWVASIEYSLQDLVISAEYSRWHTKLESKPVIPLPMVEATKEVAYLMATYRVNDWFAPGAYYSILFPRIANRSGRANQQHDVAATLRFDLSQHWLLKLEGHYMDGTAALSSDQNGGRPLSQLVQHWGLLLAKTTAYF